MFVFVKTIEVNLPELESMRLAHYITIGSECNASLARHLGKLYVSEFTILQVFNHFKNDVNFLIIIICTLIIRNMDEVGWDARAALSLYGAFDSKEYLNAQRIRYLYVVTQF